MKCCICFNENFETVYIFINRVECCHGCIENALRVCARGYTPRCGILISSFDYLVLSNGNSNSIGKDLFISSRFLLLASAGYDSYWSTRTPDWVEIYYVYLIYNLIYYVDEMAAMQLVHSCRNLQLQHHTEVQYLMGKDLFDDEIWIFTSGNSLGNRGGLRITLASNKYGNI